MTTDNLIPDQVGVVATNTQAGLSEMETHRSSASTGIDEAAASSESPEVAAALFNVWNVLLAPQFEGAEQRLSTMVSGLTNLASEYDNANRVMMDRAVAETGQVVDVVIEDGKQA